MAYGKKVKKKLKKRKKKKSVKSNFSSKKYSIEWLLSQRNIKENLYKPDIVDNCNILQNQQYYFDYLIEERISEFQLKKQNFKSLTEQQLEHNSNYIKKCPPSGLIFFESEECKILIPEIYHDYRDYNVLDLKYGVYWCRDCIEYNGHSIKGDINHCWNCFGYIPQVK